MLSNNSANFWFTRTESQLVKTLKQADMPFLGLYNDKLPPKHRDYIAKHLDTRHHRFQTFMHALEQWPALLSTYLIVHLIETYGPESNYAVHPVIEPLVLGKDDALSSSDRQKLWKQFRSVATYLGLSVSPRTAGTNYIINEYLRQAGIPFQTIPAMTEQLVRYAASTGLPDLDDPDAITIWTDGFLQTRGNYLLSRVRQSLANDDTNYYIRLFIQLLQADESQQIEGHKTVIQHMRDTLQQETNNRERAVNRHLALAQIIWRDETLGVLLPPGERTWKLATSGQTLTVAVAQEERFIPIDDPLPPHITIRSDQGNEQNYPLWEDRKNNRLLIFNEQGRLLARGQLAPPDDPAEPIPLEPGHYQLLLRFTPDDWEDHVEPLDHETEYYLAPLDLAPGETLTLRRGPAALSIQGDAKPLLQLQGDAFQGLRGNRLFPSKGLHLRVLIPAELRQTHASFQLQLSASGLGETQLVPITLDDHGETRITLENLLANWQPGVARLLVELQRSDINRAMVRIGVRLWNGLQRVEDRCRFHCSAKPHNLDLDASTNILWQDSTHTLSYRDDAQRFFRPAFRVGNTLESLTCAVPGVFLSLKDYQGGDLRQTSLRKGTTLAISDQDRRVLEVYATHDGTLRLGNLEKRITFARSGVKAFHLAALTEYLSPEQHWLSFTQDHHQTPEALLNLVAPHQLTGFSATHEQEIYSLRFRLAHPLDALQVQALDVLSGQRHTVTREPDDRIWGSDSHGLYLFTEPQYGPNAYRLDCPLNAWTGGAWLLTLQARINKRWGDLANVRGDHFAGGFLHHAAAGGLVTLSDTQAIDVLKRVHRALLICYAEESWSEVAWLVNHWRTLIQRPWPGQGQILLELLSLALEHPPESESASWLPFTSLLAALPWLTAQPASTYAILASRRQGSLRLLHLLSRLHEDPVAQLRDGVIDTIVVGAFSNAAAVCGGARPEGFTLGRYREALHCQNVQSRWRLFQDEDWQPGDGDYLGALHYHHAITQLRHRYQQTLAGNSQRRGWALKLIRDAERLNLSHYGHQDWPAHWPLDDVSLELLHRSPLEEPTQGAQNLLGMIHLLSRLAQASRWEAHQPGTLERCHQCLREVSGFNDDQLRDALGFLLHLGEAIFIFYLLLWELACIAEETPRG